jgi:hypothetical protein
VISFNAVRWEAVMSFLAMELFPASGGDSLPLYRLRWKGCKRRIVIAAMDEFLPLLFAQLHLASLHGFSSLSGLSPVLRRVYHNPY